MKRAVVFILCTILVFIINSKGYGACPSSDLSSDCKVNLKDFAIIASEWLTTYSDADLSNMASEWLMEGVPEDPYVMVWVSINDSGSDMKDGNGNPINEGGFIGEMSKFETTNAQFCHFLNEALASGDITVDDGNVVYGAGGSNDGADFVGENYFRTYASSSDSQITFDGSSFSVRSRSNHPVVEVSWYGATAFCNYYGFRLPTEWEWQAVADYGGSYTHGCGTSIDLSKANYSNNNPLSLSSSPYTSPVSHFPSYGYGMNDMAGNVLEWTDSIYSSGTRVIRGGSWYSTSTACAVWFRTVYDPSVSGPGIGFRVCR